MGIVNEILRGIKNKQIKEEQICEILDTVSESEESKLLIALKELHSVHNERLIEYKEKLLNNKENIDTARQELKAISDRLEAEGIYLYVKFVLNEEQLTETERDLINKYYSVLADAEHYENSVKYSGYLLPILESFIDKLAVRISC